MSHNSSAPLRADFSRLARTGYGIGLHWTTWTQPPRGWAITFEQAVERFDVAAFVEQVLASGAGHVLMTLNHELHWLPCPSSETDRILPGRTNQRDLVGEIIDALQKVNVLFVGYYHHGCDAATQDPAWQEAVGGYAANPAQLFDNIARITGELGRRYGDGLAGWWFDAGYALPPRGSVPWPMLLEAAKAGHAARLVTWNSGIHRTDSLTPLQDYWPGEQETLSARPQTLTASDALPWYAFVTWHGKGTTHAWGMDEIGVRLERSQPPVADVVNMIRAYNAVGGCVTCNVLCYQDGSIYPPDQELLVQIRQQLRGQ